MGLVIGKHQQKLLIGIPFQEIQPPDWYKRCPKVNLSFTGRSSMSWVRRDALRSSSLSSSR